LQYVGETEQVLFTTTDTKLFSAGFVEAAEIWNVHDGTVQVQKKEQP